MKIIFCHFFSLLAQAKPYSSNTGYCEITLLAKKEIAHDQATLLSNHLCPGICRGTQDAVENTVSTPYMGFNLGSTKYRQTSAGKIEPYVFESPLIRLMKNPLYQDAFHDGQILPQGPVSPKSIVRKIVHKFPAEKCQA